MMFGEMYVFVLLMCIGNAVTAHQCGTRRTTEQVRVTPPTTATGEGCNAMEVLFPRMEAQKCGTRRTTEQVRVTPTTPAVGGGCNATEVQFPWMKAQKCGTRRSTERVRVTSPIPVVSGGRNATEGQFPWMVALYENGTFKCSASIVSDRLVMTAAHCISKMEGSRAEIFEGHAGSVNKSTPKLKIRFRSLHPHPEYDKQGNPGHDIAVLVANEPIQFDDRVRPLCLASRGFRPRRLSKVLTMGWGMTRPGSDGSEILQYTHMRVQSPSKCKGAAKQSETICASAHGKEICSGDSGGPLVSHGKRGRPIQVGVTSATFTPDAARISHVNFCGSPSVFARVSFYQQFVADLQTKHKTKVCFADE